MATVGVIGLGKMGLPIAQNLMERGFAVVGYRRSGTAELGKWLTETRNVSEDYKRIYGEEPAEQIGAVSLSINSQNTSARAEALFGEILFKKP